MTDEPLIWTSRGNVPLASLTRTDGWEFSRTNITYWEQYTAADGEIVKRSVAVYALPDGLGLKFEQGAMNA